MYGWRFFGGGIVLLLETTLKNLEMRRGKENEHSSISENIPSRLLVQLYNTSG